MCGYESYQKYHPAGENCYTSDTKVRKGRPQMAGFSDIGTIG